MASIAVSSGDTLFHTHIQRMPHELTLRRTPGLTSSLPQSSNITHIVLERRPMLHQPRQKINRRYRAAISRPAQSSKAGIEYRPLKHGPEDKEIRLLQYTRDTSAFLSGLRPDNNYRLRTVSLNDNYPSYVALSYCWGSSDAAADTDCAIFVNDGRVVVTANLFDALESIVRYWSADKPLFIWCDRICINQLDMGEKGHQVAFMSEIYKYAEQVFVYLGSPSSALLDAVPHAGWFDPVAIERITSETLESKPWARRSISHDEWVSFGLLWEKKKTTYTYSKSNDYVKAWQKIDAILKAPWWTRVWIFQEYMFAFKAVFLWGYSSFQAEDFMKLFKTMDDRRGKLAKVLAAQPPRTPRRYLSPAGPSTRPNSRPTTPDPDERYQDENSLLRICKSSQWSGAAFLIDNRSAITAQSTLMYNIPLSKLLAHARNCGCTDPRDRVFAFASFIDSKYGIRVDYSPTNTWFDVSVETASAIIRKEADLSIILLASGACNPNPLDNKLPTWVPDFSIRSDAPSDYLVFLSSMKRKFVTCNVAMSCTPSGSFQSDEGGKRHRELIAAGSLVDILSTSITTTTSRYWMWMRGSNTGKAFGVPSNVVRNDEVWVLRGLAYPIVVSKRRRGYLLRGQAAVDVNDLKLVNPQLDARITLI